MKKSYKKYILRFLLFAVLYLSQQSCNTTEPPPINEYSLNLKLEDVSCTEAWIQFTSTGLGLPNTLTLYVDDKVSETISLSTEDTLLYIDSLLPNRTYKILVAIKQPDDESNKLSIKTMDTTSHNFTWQTWTFGGQAGSCTLYDVAIINENDIWAVGEINIADTSQNGYTTYNAVHWDGEIWELKRIQALFRGNIITVRLESVFAFSSTDIWMVGSLPIHGDGFHWTMYDLRTTVDPSLSLSKVWGSNTNNMYFVGNSGSIAHYNGQSWIKIESGTDLDFVDIYGATDPKSGEQQILTVCTNSLPLDKGIFKIDGNMAVKISSEPIQWDLNALWFIPNRHYYVIGSGIYEKTDISEILWKDNGFDITHYATTGIRGNALNDVFVTGAFGEFLHFNGVTWKSYINDLGSFSGSYGGIAVMNNTVVTVGYEGAKAKILMGHR